MATPEITAEEVVAALEQHFGKPMVQCLQLERDIAIWICRHWTETSARKLAMLFSCDDKTIAAADKRMSEPSVPVRAARALAEDYLASEAFPLEDEDAEVEDAMAAWSAEQAGRV